MKVKNETWPIAKLRRMEPKVNPQPQYQRGPVWSRAAKQLLIDSILCDFDIPKIYLHTRKSVGTYQYDVTDGQQRLLAIWEFLRDEFPLGNKSYKTDASWCGRTFTQLLKEQKGHLLAFKLIIAIISDAANDEVRELFSRLQRGIRLTPPELRNSIPSQLGDAVRSIADTHKFFTGDSCPFDDTRFQHRDLCALIFGLILYEGKRDLKAPTLKEMFILHASLIPDGLPEKAMRVLDLLHEVQTHSNGAIKTKWGFVDLCWCLSLCLDSEIDANDIATRYVAFERRRRRYMANPQTLLDRGKASGPSASDTRLFNYIEAFKTSGGVAKNLRQRHDALVAELRMRPAQKKRR